MPAGLTSGVDGIISVVTANALSVTANATPNVVTPRIGASIGWVARDYLYAVKQVGKYAELSSKSSLLYNENQINTIGTHFNLAVLNCGRVIGLTTTVKQAPQQATDKSRYSNKACPCGTFQSAARRM